MKELQDFLNTIGWTGDFESSPAMMTKSTKIQIGQIVINGRPTVQTQMIDICIYYIGDGEIESASKTEPISGFNIVINNEDQGDIWLDSMNLVEEFKNSLKKIL